jgi:oligopeptide/dipeptide ABC transporter ATP-binding protein
MATAPVLEIRGLEVVLRRRKERPVPFLQGITLSLGGPEEIFCLVGESGSGKSLTALTLFGALPSGFSVAAGSIRLCGEEIAGTTRGRDRMAYVFQDPGAALNPVFTAGCQLADVARARGREGGTSLIEVLDSVAIPDPAGRLRAYPHEFSGGMQQRLVISMALLARPVLLVADEPTTALDLTVQDRILRLLKKVRGEGTAILLITHDFGVVAEMASRVGVMYAGRLAETAPAEALFEHPLHPYTRLLLEARPSRGLTPIPGDVPSLLNPPSGCPFHPRCPSVLPVCRESFPEAGSRADREVFCHLYD